MSSNNLPHNAPQGQVPITQTRVMSPARALTLAAFAIEYFNHRNSQSGDLAAGEVSDAWDVISRQINSTCAGPKRNALLTARLALRCLTSHLLGYKRTRVIPVGRLAQAGPVIGRILEQAEREEDAYWADFAAAALEEAMAVIDEAVQL